ncbi:MAG: Na/Pi cotransporter family protein [Mariniphaga sp.]|nr:Na/Pi cotransporter family protein [Mariniphaga sp.]
MQYGLIDLLKLLGSLGLFLFGMKLMSESLQRVAGNRMRSILAALTANKYRGVFTGLLITTIVQSSSATTVMLVSFVNAGLLTFGESIGVIMGANIGTTVTAWLISILGFKVNISVLVLPLIGLSLPMLFSKNSRRSSWGSVVVGFAIIFIGLDFLKSSAPDINSNPEMLEFFTQYSNFGFGSVLIFLLIGTGLTMIIQSSSAVIALTLVMCFNCWISFDMAAAMVLGENIGTTITANLAALVANTSAKRTAMAHLLFNAVGVMLVLMFYYPFLHLVESITLKTGLMSPFELNGQTAQQTAEAMPVALSIFHTTFNVMNTSVQIWFVPLIEKTVVLLIKKKDEEEDFRLQFINIGLLSTSELSIVQARKEISNFAGHILKMYQRTRELVFTSSDKKHYKLMEKVEKYEEISDTMEVEIASYLTKITAGMVSISGTEDVNEMLILVSDLESIGDSCNAIAQIIKRKKELDILFTPEVEKNLEMLFSLIDTIMMEMMVRFDESSEESNITEIETISNKLLKVGLKLQTEHYKNLRKGVYKIKPGVIYSDLYNEVLKLRRHIYHISGKTISLDAEEKFDLLSN